MKKLIVVAIVAGIALVVLRSRGERAGGVQGLLERLPDDSPPKWMFANIAAIRENTDRILERLPSEAVSSS